MPLHVTMWCWVLRCGTRNILVIPQGLPSPQNPSRHEDEATQPQGKATEVFYFFNFFSFSFFPFFLFSFFLFFFLSLFFFFFFLWDFMHALKYSYYMYHSVESATEAPHK